MSELDQTAEQLRQLVQRTVPKASMSSKYGGTLFTLKPDEKEGQFCGVFAYKAHVQISFSEGVHIDDPEGLLSGSGKGRRHINFKTVADIDIKSLSRMIRQSAKLSVNKRPG